MVKREEDFIIQKINNMSKEGYDSKKRWGNSGLKGHGVNSPAMMEARKTAHQEKAIKGMYTSPTGSKHRFGSQKHKYWEGLKKHADDLNKHNLPGD